MEKEFKSGFVTIVGLPNVGKSTLLNALAGQKIAIISDKPQTTRGKILAVYNDEDSQIVFIDTPGLHKPKSRLGEIMMRAADESARDADIVVMVADATTPPNEREKSIAAEMSAGAECILVLNKVDVVNKEALLPIIAEYSAMADFAAVVPLSAKNNDGVDILVGELKARLEAGPLYYDEETVTDRTEKELAAEIVREKMLIMLDKEVPHGVAIEIEKMKEKESITEISAVIYCEKASHKGIIIGKNGEMLKKIGKDARVDIEEMLDKKVFLELWVRVKKDWRNNNFLLKNFGFTSDGE